MLKVSDAFNSAFAAPDRELRARVTIGKTVYDSDDLTSINYDSGAMTGEQFSIGSTYMNSAKIIFSHLVEGLKQLDEVLVELGVLKPDGTVEYVKMGTFIVDDKIQMDRNNNTTTIECMDRMTMLGGTYVSKLTYPARIKDVAIEIANMAGVKANETSFARLSENKINQPTGYTYRDAIGLIAQFQMGFALFDRDGLLDIRTLQDNSFKIDPNQYFLKGLVKNETFFKLNGISCTVVTTSKDENGNETSKTTVLQSGSSSGAQIKLANNVMTQDVLDRMYEALKFTNYYPFSLNWNGNPAVEAGDWLTVEDLQGNEFKVPNMSYTLTYNGGLTATSKADTSVSSPATYSYGGTISNIVNEIGGREGAEGNHIYEGTEDQKPLFPKEGDLWYKHVGPDTEERIYKDGKWEFLTSTKTANDAKKAADEASKEAEEAKNQANKAVDGANQAVAKAGFANDTATQAKSDAAAAGQQAKDALTNAGTATADAATAKNDAATAITDAKKALTDSSSAMADSAQARKDSATAIKDAADSLTSAKDAISKVGTLATSVTSQFTTVNNELKSKVNQTDYDKLKGTVTSQQTEINQNASGIKLKADKSYADTINDSVVKNTSSVGLLNDQIALTVSKTELNNTLSSYATQTWTQSQIKLTSDQINLNVSNVDSKINNLTTGAPNMLRNTANFINVKHWNHGGTLEIKKHTFWENGTKPLLVFSTDKTSEIGLSSEMFSIEKNAEYTIQFDAFANEYFTNGDVFLLSRKYGSSKGFDVSKNVMPTFTLSTSGSKHMVVTFKAPPDMDEAYVRIDNNGSKTAGKRSDLWLTNIKLAKENKPGPWSPAPEDLVTNVKYAELVVKVDGITATVANKADQSQVTQLANQISLKADTTALNELKGTVDKQGSEITLNTNSIKLKADQSSVNTLEGTVDKQGSAIDVNTKAIALKASQSTVDTLTGRVSTAEGKITVQADQIAQTVSKTELTSKLNGYATQTWTQSQIKSTADSINLNVSKVQTNLDNLKIGGTNLIQNSGFENGEAKDFERIKVSASYPTPFGEYMARIYFANGTAGTDFTKYWTLPAPITIEANTEYTMSYYYSAAGSAVGQASDFAYNGDAVIMGIMMAHDSHNNAGGQGVWKRFVRTFKLANATTITRLRIGFVTNSGNAGWKVVDNFQLEKGNKVSDHSPNPSDYASDVEFTNLEVKVNGIQTTVANKADQSQVTQLANQITSVVTDLSTESLNIIKNGSFNTVIAPWYEEDGVKYQVINANGAQPFTTNYIKVDTNNKGYISQLINSPARLGMSDWNLNFYYYVQNSVVGYTKAYVRVDYSDDKPFKYINDVQLTANGKWQKVSVPIKRADLANVSSFNVRLQFTGASGGAVYYSQIQLNKGLNPRPYTENTDNFATSSQITQLANDINLRVQKGDIINQINISPESILIAGQKVHITGQTSIDNAVIKDAMIADIKADKITAGTLNAANVNVINLNANNITTGTIKGANLSMNLNTGEILFQRGSIKSTNGKLNIDINDGTLSVMSSEKSGVLFNDGNMYLSTTSGGWFNPLVDKPKYGSIKYTDNFLTTHPGMTVTGSEGLLLLSGKDARAAAVTETHIANGLGILLGPDNIYIGGDNNTAGSIITGGKKYQGYFIDDRASVSVGDGDSSTDATINGKTIDLTFSPGGIATTDQGGLFRLSKDGRSQYALSVNTYDRTYSSGAAMTIMSSGVFGRISSASKYKLAIGEISTLNDEAHQFLSVKPKQWFDKSESEALADTMTTGNTDYIDDAKALPHTGFIAEDLYTAGLDNYVIRGNDGSIESIQYDRLPVLHHELIRELFNRLDAAEMEIYKLKQEVINNAS